MKSFAKFAVFGVSGVVLLKLFATILFPLMGLFFGIMAMTVKLALVAAVVFFVWEMLKRKRNGAHADVEVGP